MSDLYERSAAVMPPFALHKMPFGIDHASGSYLYTDDGRKILDFGSGIAVNNLGHNYPTVVKAAHEQLDKMVHCCHNLFHYEKETALAERIVGLMGGGVQGLLLQLRCRSPFEGAVELAEYRDRAVRRWVPHCKGSFHRAHDDVHLSHSLQFCVPQALRRSCPLHLFCRIPQAVRHSVQDQEDGKCPKQYFTQFDDIFKRLVRPVFGCGDFDGAGTGRGRLRCTAARMGAVTVREICDKYGIMLIFDEVQTGFGRTGNMFAWQTHGAQAGYYVLRQGHC